MRAAERGEKTLVLELSLMGGGGGAHGQEGHFRVAYVGMCRTGRGGYVKWGTAVLSVPDVLQIVICTGEPARVGVDIK